MCLYSYILSFFRTVWPEKQQLVVLFLLRKQKVTALAQKIYSRIAAPHIMKHMESIN